MLDACHGARRDAALPCPTDASPPPGTKESVSQKAKAGLVRGTPFPCATRKISCPLTSFKRLFEYAATSHGYWGFYLSNDRLNLH